MTHRQIFVNLPVTDIARTRAFWESLGYAFHPQFSGDTSVSVILGENLFAMLLAEPFFQTFTDKRIADAHATAQVAVCLSCDSREEVDALIAKAQAAGATVPRPPQDHGFMYGNGFNDLDGHAWELVYMSGTPPQA